MNSTCPRMDASIIVCTYNRADSLADTLDCLAKQVVPPEISWEVVVVDNNSKDHTRRIVEAAQARMPRLRYEFEAEQGLSYARNHGIACAAGDTLLFTDDDVCPEPDWLSRVLQGLEQHGADACGGYIAPVWEVPPPDWLTERFYGFLAVRTDRTDDYPILQPSQAPFGANMAVRRKVFDAVGLFDTSRGRKGKVLASGEDGELFERILQGGFKAVFLGAARVHHKVEAFRVTKRYLRRWRYQTSRNLAISRGVAGNNCIFGIPLYIFPQLLRAAGRVVLGYAFSAKDEAFNREMVLCHFLGLISGLYAAHRRTQAVEQRT